MQFSKHTIAIYIAGVLFGIVFVYLSSGIILAKIMSYLYQDVLPDVTLIGKNKNFYRDSYVRSYLVSNIKKANQKVMLILGSSFSYGYSLPANTTYGVLFKTYFPEYKILNASIIGVGFSQVIKSMLILRLENLKVDTLIVELNLSNVITDLKMESNQYKQKYYVQYLPYSDYLDKKVPYLTIFLAKPIGFEAIKLMDLNRIRNYDPSVFNEFHFNWDNLPNRYFENHEIVSHLIAEHKFQLLYMFSMAQQVAKHVYFFISPIDYEAVAKKSQFKTKDLKKDIDLLSALCHQSGPSVVCLKTKNFKEENYTNLSHFNQKGHINLAAWLAGEIKKNEQR